MSLADVAVDLVEWHAAAGGRVRREGRVIERPDVEEIPHCRVREQVRFSQGRGRRSPERLAGVGDSDRGERPGL